MLRSRLFYSQHAYRQKVKSPVDFVLGLVRTLDAEASPMALALAMEGLGQKLFAPPNVKGWDGGKTWLNSATLLARHNLAWAILHDEPLPEQRRLNEYRGGATDFIRSHAVAFVQDQAGKNPEEQVAFVIDLFLQGDCALAARQKLVEYLTKAGDRTKRLREVLHTVALMPEYQLA
jgi:hypothetical protein